jgi:hypothetical protein
MWELDGGVGFNAQWSQPVQIAGELSTQRTGVELDTAHHRSGTGFEGLIFTVPGLWRVHAILALQITGEVDAWFGPYEGSYAVGLRPSGLVKPGYSTFRTGDSGGPVTLDVDVLVEVPTSLVGTSYQLTLFNGMPTTYIYLDVDLQRSVIEAHLLEDWTTIV